jgi:hypothetical protein
MVEMWVVGRTVGAGAPELCAVGTRADCDVAERRMKCLTGEYRAWATR